jgi:hypothetical protein
LQGYGRANDSKSRESGQYHPLKQENQCLESCLSQMFKSCGKICAERIYPIKFPAITKLLAKTLLKKLSISNG